MCSQKRKKNVCGVKNEPRAGLVEDEQIHQGLIVFCTILFLSDKALHTADYHIFSPPLPLKKVNGPGRLLL